MRPSEIADFVAHQVCQGRSIDTTLYLLRKSEWFRENGVADEQAVLVYKSLTSGPASRSSCNEPDALALIGDFPHNPAYIRSVLEPVLASAGLAVRFIYDVRQLTTAALCGKRLLVVLRDGMLWPEPGGEPVWWMTDEQEGALVEFVRSGGGYLALHNATALRCVDDAPYAYRDMLGSSYRGHGPDDERFVVHVVKRRHPVTLRVSSYPAMDERHCPVLHADDITVLACAHSGEESSVNAYVREHGAGRVCYLANGHTAAVLGCRSMRRMISNAALWCARLD